VPSSPAGSVGPALVQASRVAAVPSAPVKLPDASSVSTTSAVPAAGGTTSGATAPVLPRTQRAVHEVAPPTQATTTVSGAVQSVTATAPKPAPAAAPVPRTPTQVPSTPTVQVSVP
jgi:hypothetical protein